MNMKKLLAGVLGATMLMSNVAFADVTTTTTTTYDVVEKTYTVSTDISGVENNSMVTYVLYSGNDTTVNPFNEDDGSVTPTLDSVDPDKANIIYIDQNNGVKNNSATFTATGLTVGEAYGSRIIIGTDVSVESDSSWDDDSNDMYQVLWDANSVGIEKITLVVALGEISKEFNLTSSNPGPVYIPCAADCTATFVPETGKEIKKVLLNGVENDSDATTYPFVNMTKGTQFAIGAKAETAQVYTVVTLSDAIIDATNKSVTYMVSVTGGDAENTGLNITIGENEFNNLTPAQVVEGKYAIRIVDNTLNGELGITESVECSAVPFIGDTVLTDAQTGNRYTVDATLDEGVTEVNE